MTWQSHALSKRVAAYWITFAALAIAFLLFEFALGFEYPIPWPDEGSFLWPAISFQRESTLLAPQLNSERPIMWMPPAYMIVQGIIFKLTGFSFVWARMLSALYVALGGGLLAAVFSRLRNPFSNLLLLAVFLFSPIVRLTGNLARMEGLLFAVAMLGLLVLQRGRLLVGLALTSLLPLIHPNGGFLFLGVGLYALWVRCARKEPLRLTRVDWIVSGCALFAWLGYCLYVTQHWDAFLHDMAYQFGQKGKAGTGMALFANRLRMPGVWVPFALALASICFSKVRKLPSILLLIYVLPLCVLSLVVVGFPYDFFAALTLLLTSVFVLEVLTSMSSRVLPLARPHLHAAIGIVLVVFLAGVNQWCLHSDPLFLSSVRNATVTLPMGSRDVRYFSESDDRAIREFLGFLEGFGSVSVAFFPSADALFFEGMESESLRFLQPTLSKRYADVQIVHLSRYIPPAFAWQIRALQLVFTQGVEKPLDTWETLYRRDMTEAWKLNVRDCERVPICSEASK